MFPVKVEYGHDKSLVDVTIQALHQCLQYDVLVIPPEDEERNHLFGDPFFGIFKSIVLNSKDVFKIGDIMHYPLEEKKSPGMRAMNEVLHFTHAVEAMPCQERNFVLQVLCALFIRNRRVLELGAGPEGNACNFLASQDNTVVALECDPTAFAQLTTNQKIGFGLEQCALSNVPLMQHQESKQTFLIPSESGCIADQCELVNTITFGELQKKYQLVFNTIVSDCGSAFLQLMQQDAETVLDKVDLLLLVNVREEKEELKCLAQHGFQLIHTYPLLTNKNYYQVWKKTI